MSNSALITSLFSFSIVSQIWHPSVNQNVSYYANCSQLHQQRHCFFRRNLKLLCSGIAYIITLYKTIVLYRVKVCFSAKNLSSWTLSNRHFLFSLLSFIAQIEVIHKERSLFSMIFNISIR